MTQNIATLPLQRIDGSAATLADYRGKVLLIVNVASRCGLTPQYEGLEALYRAKRDSGLEILAFPANNFKGQEPGTNEEIKSFCQSTYDVSFPLFAKVSVVGADQHPLYAALTAAQPAATGDGPLREKLSGMGIETTSPPDVLWNFEKFLVSRDGEVVARFAPNTAPDDAQLTAAIERELARG